jgi:hypothetical protein
LELPDWNATGLDDSAWRKAAVFEPPPVLTAAQMVEPNRIVETIKATRVEAYPQGGWVVDMGKNFTGWLEITLPPAAKGSTVKLEYFDQMERDKPAPGAAGKIGRPRFRMPGQRRLAGEPRARSAAGYSPRRHRRRKGRARRQPTGFPQHLQPARRSRRHWRDDYVSIAIQLSRISIRARHWS